ncbi:MAG: hypothetical protein KAT56_03405 [Sedimentisphaerales bacterium]|nr:hypothetical protein [Sedimentisphaerales bacterium]
MSEDSQKDENKQENDPTISGPTDPPPDEKSRADNGSAAEKKPAESTQPGDIDGLLAAAADSLADVDDQLGQDDSAENQASIQEKDVDLTSPGNRVSEVDNTLDNLEKELNTLLEEVSEDDEPKQVNEQVNEADKSGTENQTADIPTDTATEAPAESANNIDDVLAELAEELEQDEPVTAEDEKVSTTDTPAAVEDEPTPETNDIDETPAQLEQEITETPAAEQKEPQSVQPEKPADDNETERQPSQAESQIAPDEDPQKAQSIIDNLPDIGGADEDDEPQTQDAPTADTPADEQSNQAKPSSNPSEQTEPTAETTPKTDQTQPATEADQPTDANQATETDQAVSEVDQVVMKELAEVEGKAEEPAPSTAESGAGRYSYLNFPQRTLVQSLETVNKPFGSVPDKTKDILGMIGVVTMIVSVIAAALILLIVN